MNLGAPVGQGPPGQANSQPAAGQPRPNQQPMYRPEMMRSINFLTDEEKMKYEKGLSALWKTYDTFAQGTMEKAEAQKKIVQFGAMLASKVTGRKQALQAQQAQRAQQQAQQQGQQQGQQSLPAARVGQQGQQIPGQQQPVQRPMPQQQQPQHPQAIQQQQTTPIIAPQTAANGPGNAGNLTPSTPTIPNTPVTNNPPPPGAAPPVTKLPPQYVEIVQNLNVPAPPNVPDKAKWLNELKQRYARALMQMDASRANINKVDQHLKEREEKGIPLSEEEKKSVKDRKDTLIKQFQDARGFVEGVRNQQKAPLAQTAPAPANIPGAVGNQPRPQPPPSQVNTAAIAAQQAKPQVQVPVSNAPQNNAMNNQMMNNQMQNSTAAVNAAIEAAKNQQIAAGRPPQGVNGGMAGPQGSQPHQTQAPTAPVQTQQNQNQMNVMHPNSQAPLSQQTTAQPQPHQPPIKIEPGTQPHPIPTPLNTAIASNMAGMPSAGTPTQNNLRVQTPQSATPTGTSARPLTHAAAVNLASQPRSGSIAGPMNTGQGGTPASAQGVMGAAVQQGHPHAHPPQQGTPGSTVTSKLPIPKNLSERAMQVPTPVAATTGGRPTYSGGTGIGGGVMNQPALPKTPGYSLEGEGERVLNKKKLDELVRQVCGGTEEGQEGNLLAPEVEEVSLCDSFGRFSSL